MNDLRRCPNISSRKGCLDPCPFYSRFSASVKLYRYRPIPMRRWRSDYMLNDPISTLIRIINRRWSSPLPNLKPSAASNPSTISSPPCSNLVQHSKPACRCHLLLLQLYKPFLMHPTAQLFRRC